MRIAFRLSGTSTGPAVLWVYLECCEPDESRLDRDGEEALAPLASAADAIAGIKARTGRRQPGGRISLHGLLVTKKDHRGGEGHRVPIDLDCEKALALLASADDAIVDIRARNERRQPSVLT